MSSALLEQFPHGMGEGRSQQSCWAQVCNEAGLGEIWVGDTLALQKSQLLPG